MVKHRLASGVAAVALFTLLSVLSVAVGIETNLTATLIQAAIALVVVTIVWCYVLPRRQPERQRA